MPKYRVPFLHEGAAMSSYTTISPDKLARLIGTANAPALIDVRTDEDFAADPRLIPGAVRRSHQDAADWGGEFAGSSAIVVCHARRRSSRRAPRPGCGMPTSPPKRWKAALKAGRKPSCRWCHASKLPPRDAQGRTVWVTRARPKIDRIACPWLIRRFVDPNAVFLFVAPSEVVAVGERFNAAPFDIENVFWSHRGELCTFDVMVEEFGLATPPLLRLATMVRAADTARLDLSPEAPGLLAASLGLSRMYDDDLEQLEAGIAALRRVLSLVPRRDRRDPQLADQQGEAVIDIADERRPTSRSWTPVTASASARPSGSGCGSPLLSFGGPAGQIAVMHRILVEEKNWISESRFLHALNYCMLLPGPEAQQLATYIGWLMHRTAGGIMAGGLFILPGIIAIMGLSYIYAAYGNVGFVEALFFGLKAAVLAIVIQAVVRVGKRALRNRVMIALAAIAFVAIFFFNVPFPIIIIARRRDRLFRREERPAGIRRRRARRRQEAAAAVDSMLGEELPDHVRPSVARALKVSAVWLLLWLVPVAALLIGLGQANVFSQIALFFSKMAMVTFGGAYAVLAYVAQQAVEHYHWLQPREMLDGLGMAETTPGPLIMVLQFVGFMAAFRDPGTLSPMLAGTLGGLLATWVTFTPCFLWIFLGAPFIETLRGNKGLAGALTAITAAVVGVILNLSIWFALHTRVPADHAGPLVRAVVRHAGVVERRYRGAGAGDCGRDRDLPLQSRAC